METKNNKVISTGIICRIELLRLYLVCFVCIPFFVFYRPSYFIIVSLYLLFTLSFLRVIYFYENEIKVKFIFRPLKRVKKIPYESVEKLIYKFGQHRGNPTIFIKPIESKKSLFDFFVWRFIIENPKKREPLKK